MRRRNTSAWFTLRVSKSGMVTTSFASCDAGRIAQLRGARRWSADELARRINRCHNHAGRVTGDDVDSWETGDAPLPCNVLGALEGIFRCPMDRFIRRVTVRFRPDWLLAERVRLGFGFLETARLAHLRPKELRALERGEFAETDAISVGQHVLDVVDAIGSSMPEVRARHGTKRKAATRAGRVLRLVAKSKAVAS